MKTCNFVKDTGVFLWMMQNFQEQHFSSTHVVTGSVTFKLRIKVKWSKEIQYTYVNVWCLREIYVPMHQHWINCFTFHVTFLGSFNTLFMLDHYFLFHPPFHSYDVISNIRTSKVFCKKRCSKIEKTWFL